MQLVLNFKNVLVGTALVSAGYFGYRNFVADIQTNDIRKLMRAHRDADVGRQIIIKRRIFALYDSHKDYNTVARSLDGPSPVSQALAVEILTAKHEERALPKLLEMINEPNRAGIVKQQVAEAMAAFRQTQTIPRLIQLTDTAEPLEARSAAHSALQKLTGAGNEVRFGDGSREHWALWWRDHKTAMR